jgi:transmembrane sensor
MGLEGKDMEMNDEVLISYLLGEVSDDQACDIDNWRLKDPANELRFKRFQLIWETSKILDLQEPIDPVNSLARLKGKIDEQRSEDLITIQLKPTYNWLKAVAAVVLIASVAWLYISTQTVEGIIATTDQIVRIDTLKDGSIVTLNKNSVLEYPSMFKGKQRQVVLAKGEAFFDVAPDKDKPFLIKSGRLLIRVVGTSFNVKLKNGVVEVIVESGKVQVTSGKSNIFLEPGEKVTVSENSADLEKEMTQDLLYNYYRTKEFVADDTPLWRMVEALNEAYDSKIVIKNPAIRELPLNTTFKDESLDDILQVISRTFKITVEKKQSQILLK